MKNVYKKCQTKIQTLHEALHSSYHFKSISNLFCPDITIHTQTKQKPQKTDSPLTIWFLHKIVGQDRKLEETPPSFSVMVVHVDDLHSHNTSSHDRYICLFEHYSCLIHRRCLLCFKEQFNTLTNHMIECGVSLPFVSPSPVPADSAGSPPTSYG